MVRRLQISQVITLSLLLAGSLAAQTPVTPSPATPPASAPAVPFPSVPAAAHSLETPDLEAFFDGIIPLQLERSDVAGASVLVMKDGRVLLKKGYGYSDVGKKSPVDPDSTIFRLASISKLFTWISVMQLAEQSKLDLDTDINRYLDFQINPAFSKPITLRNLMTHTGGFEEVIRDILITDPRLGSSLRDFLIANQPHRLFPPGVIPGYSNYGVGLGGYIVQRISGEPFEQFVSHHIFQPLGMLHSSFHQPLNDTLVASEGYKDSTEKPPIGFEIFNPAPAGGVSSTAADMARFSQALLNYGELDGHRILKPETLHAMWTRQFAASDQLPGICMGFYQVWRNGLHFIGHEGDLIAFHSLFFVEPTHKLVLFISYNSARSANKARDELLNGFADRYYPFVSAPPSPKFSLAQLKSVEGLYQSTRRADSTKLKLLNLGEQARASVDKDGVLKLSKAHDLRGHLEKWRPIGPDLWQAEGEQDRLFAIRDSSGKVVRLAYDFAGVQAERVPWYERHDVIVPALGASFSIVLLAVGASLFRLIRRLFFRSRPPFSPQPGTLWLSPGLRFAAFGWVFVGVATAILLSVLQGADMPPGHLTDKWFVLLNWLAFFALLLTVFAIIPGVRVWRIPETRWISRVKFTLVALSCLFLAWFSVHWNLLGPAHRF